MDKERIRFIFPGWNALDWRPPFYLESIGNDFCSRMQFGDELFFQFFHDVWEDVAEDDVRIGKIVFKEISSFYFFEGISCNA